MKYLKLVNVPISEFCCHAKLTNGEKRIPWTECGFNCNKIMKKAVQFEDVNGDHIQYLPIQTVSKVKTLIKNLKSILSEDGNSAEIVEDEQLTWKTQKEESNEKQAIKSEARKIMIAEKSKIEAAKLL